MEQNHQLGKTNGPFISNSESYSHLVGSLIYLTIIRSDLAYSVQVLALYTNQNQCTGMLLLEYYKS